MPIFMLFWSKKFIVPILPFLRGKFAISPIMLKFFCKKNAFVLAIYEFFSVKFILAETLVV